MALSDVNRRTDHSALMPLLRKVFQVKYIQNEHPYPLLLLSLRPPLFLKNPVSTPEAPFCLLQQSLPLLLPPLPSFPSFLSLLENRNEYFSQEGLVAKATVVRSRNCSKQAIKVDTMPTPTPTPPTSYPHPGAGPHHLTPRLLPWLPARPQPQSLRTRLYPTHICQINALKTVFSPCNFPSQSHLGCPITSRSGLNSAAWYSDSPQFVSTCLDKLTSGCFLIWSQLLLPTQSHDELPHFSSPSFPTSNYI